MHPSRLAWNGISLDPGSRAVRMLDRNTIIIGDDHEAVQIRWKRVLGRFNAEKHIRKLSKGKATAVPQSEPTVHGFHRADFAAEGVGGSVLHHAGTGVTVEIQHASDASGIPELLTSVTDHSGGKSVPWQAFGLHVRLAPQWLLASSSFRPGRFTLEFVRTRRKRIIPDAPEKGHALEALLTLERLAPADALLGGRRLCEWAREVWSGQPVPDEDDLPLVWSHEPQGMKRLLPGRRNRYGRISRPEAGNVILAVFLQSRRSMAESFDHLTESYGIVQTEETDQA